MNLLNLKRVFIIILVLIFSSNKKVSATALEPGDIAFLQVNYTVESFDFILLKSIEAGTKIKFTDYSYTSANGLVNNYANDPDNYSNSENATYEIIATYTAPSDMLAGSIIQSRDNGDFDVSNFDFESHLYINGDYAKRGETVIAFQASEGDTTYLSAIGWMSKNNFRISTNHGTSEVPPGLSFEDNTVVQLDSITDYRDRFQRDFTYYSGYGNTGSAYYLRSLFSETTHFQTYDNTGTITSGTFTVLPDDTEAPVLKSTSPEMDATNASKNTNFVLVFNEIINLKKGAVLKKEGLEIYSLETEDIAISNNNEINFLLEGKLEANTSYTITMPANFIADNDGNYWPSESTDFSFSTASKQNSILLNFNSEDIVNPSWTLLTSGEENGNYTEYGYYGFTEKGISCKSYLSINGWGEAIVHPTWREEVHGAIDCLGGGEKALIDLSDISSQISYIKARVQANNTPLVTKVYYNGEIVQQDSISGTGNSSLTEEEWGLGYLSREFYITSGQGVDSISVETLEGSLLQLYIDFSDLGLPTVNLGADQVLCYGDTTILSTTPRIGESILWSTGETSTSITINTSGTYTLTKTNSLGSVSDDVQISFTPELIYPFNAGNLTGCVGEDLELNAGVSELTYSWDDTTLTDNIRYVSESKWYKVNISSPGCWSIRDSVYVTFTGGSLLMWPEQMGVWNTGDLEGQLYKEDTDGNYELYEKINVSDYFEFYNLPASNYIFKAHFLNFTQDSVMDTYHNGGIVWEDVSPIVVTCTSNEQIDFTMHDAPTYEFTGSGTISGVINSIIPKSVSLQQTTCDIKVNLLLNNVLIASTCADSNGNFSFAGLSAGDYQITIEATGYASNYTPYDVSLVDGEALTGFDFNVSPDQLTIERTAVTNTKETSRREYLLYPNPATDVIHLQNLEGEYSLKICDAYGRLVFSGTINATNPSININGLASGALVLHLQQDGINTIIPFLHKR